MTAADVSVRLRGYLPLRYQSGELAQRSCRRRVAADPRRRRAGAGADRLHSQRLRQVLFAIAIRCDVLVTLAGRRAGTGSVASLIADLDRPDRTTGKHAPRRRASNRSVDEKHRV